MDYVNMFDLVTFSDAYQRALAFEKHNRWVESSSSPTIIGGGSGSSNVASHFIPNQARPCGGSGLKCFNCGEPGHRLCLVFDDDQYEEEIVSGDVGVNLMVRRSCLTPKAVGDDWLKHNIFQSSCTILGKNRPKPYKLQWLKKGGEVTVSKGVLVTFSVGTTYKDSVWCDMVPMDTYCWVDLGNSSNDDLVRNSRTDFIYPMGNDTGLSVEELALLFLEAQDHVKKRTLFKVAKLGNAILPSPYVVFCSFAVYVYTYLISHIALKG
ncbi:putative reverse transcriptase domain-containing protein [Tanacetum coccineum]|uniref:Reverse transcriptase domain-containing protein n=1 Tax=Tanacetum coccineum TaxID=301880 RepID=A0ABQ5DYJ6_9ASTR